MSIARMIDARSRLGSSVKPWRGDSLGAVTSNSIEVICVAYMQYLTISTSVIIGGSLCLYQIMTCVDR